MNTEKCRMCNQALDEEQKNAEDICYKCWTEECEEEYEREIEYKNMVTGNFNY
jgi:hypothetical protein